MQWRKLQNNPTYYHYSSQKREGLEVDGHLALTYLLFWHPNPGRVFPLGLPLRAVDFLAEEIKSDCDPKEPHTTVFGMIRESQSWVIFGCFTGIQLSKILWNLSWSTIETKLQTVLANCQGHCLQILDLQEQTWPKKQIPGRGKCVPSSTSGWKMLGYLQWTPNSPSMEIHAFMVWRWNLLFPGSVTRTMQFVMLVPRHSTMSVVAGSAEWWESCSTQWWLGPDFCCKGPETLFNHWYFRNCPIKYSYIFKIGLKTSLRCNLSAPWVLLKRSTFFLPGFNWSWDVTQSQCIG